MNVGDVTFSNFRFFDIGDLFDGVPIDPDKVDVTGSFTPTTVRLSYRFRPKVKLGGLDYFEFESGFFAALDPSSTRLINSIGFGLTGFSRTGDAFIEIAGDSPEPIVFASTSGDMLTDVAALALLSNIDFDFDAQGESFDDMALASLHRFTVTLGMDSEIAVPIPATLPLLLSGVSLFAFFAHRKRAA